MLNCVAVTVHIDSSSGYAVLLVFQTSHTRGDGGLVRVETAARCVVVAYWDAVLRAGRGLKRVEQVWPISRDMRARKGTA